MSNEEIISVLGFIIYTVTGEESESVYPDDTYIYPNSLVCYCNFEDMMQKSFTQHSKVRGKFMIEVNEATKNVVIMSVKENDVIVGWVKMKKSDDLESLEFSYSSAETFEG